ncbi:twin-arginine translocase TatA/TatE family subunit [Sulfurospirillum multivorans]|uniref:Sec-independent protein translocase protein TatA n=2 Tax=Sulfurospirillum multivorans TaxID=66821 RepID=A0AA86DXB0_SULMK|nr:twin-arginine translocase TatA/TatE family subunit [Sulfurospirillum multivorans]AHJ11843.1 twin-arginine translocation protein TatA [Sulfurospirillum multivorans DSM 12446]QEH05349.1 twin-arginine translocation protein TatA [Sulfurospirillum multivorans]
MGSFSISHWLVILAVVVLLFGAKKIPELAKGVGQGIKDFKKAIKEDEQAKTTVDQVETKPESGATPTATTSTPADEKKSV